MHPPVQAAIDAFNAGDKVRALELTQALVAAEPQNAEGWLMMAALTDDDKRKYQYLLRVLSIDPQNRIAREELVEMKHLAPPPKTRPPQPQTQTDLPPVQAALRAIKEGNKPRALEYLKQRLQEDPSDAEPWVVMTQLVDDAARQRQYLQYALKLNPNHQGARAMLTVLDRTAPAAGSTTTQTPPPTYAPQTVAPAPATASRKPAAPQIYKFGYPLWMKVIVYAMLAAFGGFALINASTPLPLTCLPLILVALGAAWVVSVRVEVDAGGVRVVQFFIRKELQWDQIAQMRTGVQRYHLQLIGAGGKSLKINSQVAGYESIVALIRQRRPDLFSAMGARKTFSDYRVFKKSLVKYVSVVIGLALLLIGRPVFWAPTWGARFGFLLLIGIGLYLIIVPLLGVRQIKVEPGILTIDWMFRNEEYRPHHIQAIYMETLRNRYGSAHHYVIIKPQDEKPITLNDFGRDTDMLYGVLMNWWQSGRS